jgi:hypothetical protein
MVRAVILMAGLAAACSSSGSDPIPPDCYLDVDCVAGQQCLDGECQGLDCASDGDCRGGMTCEDGNCEESSQGCTSDADCNGWQCVTATGTCVQCQADSDCVEGLVCIAADCRWRCLSDGDCQDPAPVCDTLTGSCVECRSDTDCGAQQCMDGRCVEEIVCQSHADCSGTTPFCHSTSGNCVQCLGDGDCDSGEECQEFTCVVTGCASDQDCEAPLDRCDTGTGECVECLSEADCDDVPGKRFCDTDRGICVQCLDDNFCQGEGQTAFCLPEENICVGCYRNAHCPDTQACDPERLECEELYIPCQECSHAGDVCIPGTVCHRFDVDNGNTDTGCLRTCIDQADCTKGFDCRVDPVGGNVCVPAYDRANGTCQAIRDYLEPCVEDENCGVSQVEDGICVGHNVEKWCTIPCLDYEDCPFDWGCEDDPSGSHDKVCVQY